VNRSLILLAVPLVAVLAACGSDEASSDTSVPSTATEASVPASDLDLDGRTFVSTAVDGHELVADSEIRLSFQDGSISINAGCNTLVGGYTLDGDTLQAPVLAMTQMACDPALMDQDTWLSETFSGTPTLAVDGDDLTVTGADGSTITFLDVEVAEPALPLEGTRWVVDGLLANEGISTVPIGAEASITITDGTAAVEAGCNTGSAPVEITDTTITFGALALTRMACGPEQTQLENAVVAVLAGEVTYTITSDTLQLRTTPSGGTGEIGLNLIGS
jgi:heat shock protein HslJ